MSHVYLQSEDALYFYLKKFLKQKPKAVQLDGSPQKRPNSQVMAVFEFSINHLKYKILGDTTRAAVETFVKLVEEHGSAALALKEHAVAGQSEVTLILANSKEPGPWKCAPYVEKASDKLHGVAS